MTRIQWAAARGMLILAALAVCLPASAESQVRRGRQVETAPRWAPVSVGVRFGWDQRANGEVAGAQIRLPILRNGKVEIVPNVEAVFPNQATEYQYNLEAHFVPGGLRGGLFLGGGFGWRDTFFGSTSSDEPRTTLSGWTVAVGGKTVLGRLQLEAAIRWAFLQDTQYRPNSVTLGLNLPFWRTRPN